MLTSARILIVEPDRVFAKLLAILIEDAGGETRIVPTAETAVAAIADFRPRLLVVDLVLPRTSGLALIDEVAHNPLTHDIVVVAITSSDDPGLAQRVRAVGAAALLRMPVVTASFAGTLQRILQGGPS